MIPHASGRPWIVGRWSDSDIVVAAAGRRRVALLGCASVDPITLAERLRVVDTVHQLDGLIRTVPGSFHLVASIDGQVRAQGSLSTACQVFSASVAGVTVAADRPQTLASLVGRGFDEGHVALRLLPLPPWPLDERCLWHEVQCLPVGHYLELRPDGRGRVARWWTPPPPEVPLAAAADVLRDSLVAAVRAHTAGGGTVSADLSGGMDSASLCFLAAGVASRLITIHFQPRDPANDDALWTESSAALLPTAQHVRVPFDRTPAYTGLTDPDPDAEGPCDARSRARLAYLARLVSALGSTRHLAGIGGDQLFIALPSVLHALVRRGPVRSIRQVRIARRTARWTRSATIRSLLDARSYARWMASCADLLTARPTAGAEMVAEWGGRPTMPAWATPEAVATARRLIREAASEDPQPIAPLRVQHQMVHFVRAAGQAARPTARSTARLGLSYEVPYLDDQVVEAALSIRLEDRLAPGRYKPVLAEAMRGVVPDHILSRTTKGEYSADLYDSLRRSRAELLELCDDMCLARMGLVDAKAFRTALSALQPPPETLGPLQSTLACESWLRWQAGSRR